MGFDLTGYERDDSYSMSSFFIYSFLSVFILVVITIALAFYFFIEHDRMYNKLVLEDEIESAIQYKAIQSNILNSHGEIILDDGSKILRVPVNEGIDRAVKFYDK